MAAATNARDPVKFEAVKSNLTAEEEALKQQLAALESSVTIKTNGRYKQIEI